MPGEIAHEALCNVGAQAVMLIHAAHVEEVTRMLAVHRRDELAAVKFRHSQHRHRQLCGEKIAHAFGQTTRLHRQHRAAENMIHFHLHQALCPAHEQLDLVAFLGADKLRFKTDIGKSPLRCGQFRSDLIQRLAAFLCVIGIHHINVHGEARHFMHEEVQRRTALECKTRCAKNVRSGLQQQAHRLNVCFVHHGFRMRVVPSFSRVLQRLRPRVRFTD